MLFFLLAQTIFQRSAYCKYKRKEEEAKSFISLTQKQNKINEQKQNIHNKTDFSLSAR